MAKYLVEMRCGHKEEVSLDGDALYIAKRKVLYRESGLCSKCANNQYQFGHHEVTMHYSRYKEEYGRCNYKKGSYDSTNKTITVYVPD